MTTGAIYGNFKNRDELFIALGQTYWAPVTPRVKPGATFAEVMHAMAEATLEAIPERTTAAVGRLTGLAYALTSPDLRARVREITAGSYELGAEWLRTLGDQRELPMPPEHLVRVIHALIEGLVLQRILTPELFPDEVFFAAFEALAHHRREPDLDATPVVEEPSAGKGPAPDQGRTLVASPESLIANPRILESGSGFSDSVIRLVIRATEPSGPPPAYW